MFLTATGGGVTSSQGQGQEHKKRLLIGPICLDDIPQISCLLPIVQGKDLRDSVSHPGIILECVEFRAAGEVESGVSRLGQHCGVPGGVVFLAEVNHLICKWISGVRTLISMSSSADISKIANPTSWKPCNQACPVGSETPMETVYLREREQIPELGYE